VYLTGTVGGMMTSLHVPIKDGHGKVLPEESYEKTERYGRLLAEVADKLLPEAKPVHLAPFQIRSRQVYLPMSNKLYQLARQLGVLDRQAFLWTGDPYKADPAPADAAKATLGMKTEVAWLRLGELDIACIPGEIYPELVLDKVQDPADAGADFPDAA